MAISITYEIILSLQEMFGEIFGVKTGEETQVDMILDTLLGSFKQFKLNYNLNKLMMSLLELKKEFQYG
ncbi:hypothetical protein CK203_110180 [Vitis vinifera]|uniref:Uncharacterized protein n=1 Tax=Vitis vinifera TaxID=29760 RepID=A0A438FHI6_VITVI|nr:hypothetical protein CK203_110180 [Vitis vinifera]